MPSANIRAKSNGQKAVAFAATGYFCARRLSFFEPLASCNVVQYHE